MNVGVAAVHDAAFWVSYAVALAAGLSDLVSARIPNAITYPAIAAGLALSAWAGGLPGLGYSVLGLLVAAIPFLLAFVFGGGGGGDVKLMAAMGALLGFPAILSLLAHALLVGGLMGLAIVLLHRPVTLALARRAEQGSAAPAVYKRPGVRFGIAVALAIAWIGMPGLWRLPGL